MKRLNRENVAGIWSAMPTPFTDILELDVESVSRLVEHQVRLGIKGLFLVSPNGEGCLMSDSMKMELAEEVVKSNKNRMMLLMLVADNPANLMIDNIRRLQDCGIDIAVVGFPFTPIEIEQEFLRKLYFSVIEKSSLPIALYHFNRASPDSLFGEIILHPKVVLVVNCLNDPRKSAIILNTAKGRVDDLFALDGNEANCASSVIRAYDGVLLNSACFTGFMAKKILELAMLGRIKDAVEVQAYMNSILVEVFGIDLESFLIGQKQILVELGIFNTAKTLQDYPIGEEFINIIKEIVRQEKEFLLP